MDGVSKEVVENSVEFIISTAFSDLSARASEQDISELFELLLWRTGSMPSSHAALTSTLLTMIGFRSGIGSDVFMITLGFYLVTLRDAVGVRRASGIQATMLNKVGNELAQKGLIDYKPIKEVQGHTPAEVLIGSFVGFFIGLAFSVLK